MAITFDVEVKLSWGEVRHYLLANDVEPGLAHRYATRDNWQEVLIGALINVPVGPYLPNNTVQPPIATGKALGVAAVDSELPAAQGMQRTRSQFIMAAIWKQQDSTTNYNFLRHDYDTPSQEQIKADVDYWQNGHQHPAIIGKTKHRIAEQEERLAAQEKNQKKS